MRGIMFVVDAVKIRKKKGQHSLIVDVSEETVEKLKEIVREDGESKDPKYKVSIDYKP